MSAPNDSTKAKKNRNRRNKQKKEEIEVSKWAIIKGFYRLNSDNSRSDGPTIALAVQSRRNVLRRTTVDVNNSRPTKVNSLLHANSCQHEV